MNDLFRWEKFAHLPRAISKEGKAMHTYEVGDVAHWPPGPDVAIVIVVVVVVSDGFARMGAPLQPEILFPAAADQLSVTIVPATYPRLPPPSLTIRVGDPAAVVYVRALAPLNEKSPAVFFAPGIGELSKTERRRAAIQAVVEELGFGSNGTENRLNRQSATRARAISLKSFGA